MNIGIYVYDDAEVLDFAGPYEVFTTAARVNKRINPTAGVIFDMRLIAEYDRPIHARGNFIIEPHCTFQDHPVFDVLVVPGGVHTKEMKNAALMHWLRAQFPQTVITSSVCTGAFLLASAGILDGQSCTTHWEDIPDLRGMFPSLDVKEDVLWVDNGKIISSAGISAGIEMSLHMVARLAGRDLAVRTARQMEYKWNTQDLSEEQQ